jgi:hypothetical protein
MRALVERQFYRPEVVMPLLILTGLMVTLDFNVLQVALVVVLRGSRRLLAAFRGSIPSLIGPGRRDNAMTHRCPMLGSLCDC